MSELRTGILLKRNSSCWLSFTLFLVVLYISPFMLGYAGWYGIDGYRETLFYLPLQQLLFIGPAFMFYIVYLLNPQYLFSGKDWLHFLPGLAYLLYSAALFVYDILIADAIYFYRDERDKDFDLWYQVAGFISLIVYFVLSLRIYQRYRKQIFENLSFAEEVAYNWVRYFLFTFLLILLLRGLFFIINPEWGAFGKKYWYYLSISIVGYYLAIQGNKQSILLRTSILHYNPFPDSIAKNLVDSDDKNENQTQKETGHNYDELQKKIEQLMFAKSLYKNPTLMITDLAEHLDTTSKNVSQAINKETGLNFNDYVNRLRVDAFIKEIDLGTHLRQTLLAIGLDCGFNSKSTFNRAFKKYIGQSPNEYVQERLK